MSLRLGPRYRILGPVASGGMGSVLLAVAKDAKGAARPVALKQLHAHLANDPRMVEMFVDEARIASRLSHPNIVRVNDVEMINDDVVLVMDFIEGVPLSTLQRKLRDDKRPMPLPIARRIAHDVLLGLHAAHELRDDRGVLLGVIHRDVSPHNVLLGVDGTARITDFGVAKARGRLANTHSDGTVKGKLQYLAPEQIYRKAIDRRVDLFAAGIILWECLSGRRLFEGESEGETLARVINEPIDPPSTDRFDVPLDLDEVCMRALERDPKRRWSTAEEFARALESGPLADRPEVAALVLEVGAATIAEHRALLDGAKTAFLLPPPGDATSPAVSVDGTRPAPVRRRSVIGVTVAVGVGAIVGGLLTSSYGARVRGAAVSTSTSTPPLGIESSASLASTAAPSASEVRESPVIELSPPSSSIVATPPPTSRSVRSSPARRPHPPRGPRADAGLARGQFEPEDL
ncbi:MAG: Protein kinase [Labilithrix sp.]|nr:Protein kinase [Labilithrix sp.]